MNVINDVIDNGDARIVGNNAEIVKGNYKVVVTLEHHGKEKRCGLTAFDNSKTKKEKSTHVNTTGTPIDTDGSRAVTSDVDFFSEGKDNEILK